MTDAECQRCGGNVTVAHSTLQGDTVTLYVEPCHICMTDAHCKGIGARHKALYGDKSPADIWTTDEMNAMPFPEGKQ